MKNGFWEERILSIVESGLSVVNSVIEDKNERRKRTLFYKKINSGNVRTL
jgi:hypothetical protein